MAKSELSWELIDAKLIVEILATKDKLSFDLTKIWPDFIEYKLVAKNLAAYGVKQKLADKVAKSADEKLTALEKKAALLGLWDQLVKNVWRVAGVSGIKMSELKSELATAKDQLSEKDKKLAEQADLIKKLTKKTK